MISIRRALFLICILLILGPLAVFWMWPQTRLAEQETNAAREHHLLIARTLARTLERYHLDLIGAFSHVAEGLVDADPALPDARLMRPLGIRHVVVVNRSTGARVTAIDGTQTAPAEPLAPELFARLRASANDTTVFTSGVSLDANGTPVMHLVRASGPNLLIGTVDTHYFVDLGASIRFGENGHSVIVDQTGRALAHPDPAWHKSARNLGGLDIVKRILAGEAGVAEFFSPAFQADMIAGFAPVRGAGWGVMVPQPISEMRAAADSIRKHVLFVFSAGLLIAALIAIRAGLLITAPLSRLNAGARRMAEGNLDVRVEAGGRATPRELSMLTSSFNDMAERLAELRQHGIEMRERAERANRSKTEFVRTVTHELRSPVNAILGFSELLTSRHSAKITPEMRDSYLRDISAGARHLLSLVNDLLDLAKMESGQYELLEQDFWVDEITRRATRYVETQARERDMTLNVHFNGEPPMIRGDERALFQSLLNVVSNAVRYGRRSGTVDISTRILANGGVEITVADDGPGIAPDDLARVMLPFQRVRSTSNTGVVGSGLGLPIVKRFIELHGGTFELTSTLGQGTQARIVLPPERVRPVTMEEDLPHERDVARLEVAHAA